MGSVNNHALVDKLQNLNSTQQSIETVSAWCSFYRKDARKVVAIWEQEFVKMPMAKQLAMSYLANDILQNSRKKVPEFVHEFYKTLPRAVKHLLKHGDDKVKRAVNRLVDIWEDRKVFGNSGTRPFRDLAAEAETPKRSSSGVTQDQLQAVPAKFAPLEPLANALGEVQVASGRSSALVQMVVQLEEDILDSGTQSDLLAAAQLLKSYNGALQNQVSRHQHAAHILQVLLKEQEEEVQQVQGQLAGSKQQLQLVQQRLESNGAAQAQAPVSNTLQNNPYSQPLAPEQEYGIDQEYQDYADDQNVQDAEMDFDPPGSTGRLDREPSFDPAATTGVLDAAPDMRVEEQRTAGSAEQDQGQSNQYSPGLSGQPSGSYMSEPGFHSNANGGPSTSGGHLGGADEANTLPSSAEQTASADPLALMQALQALPKDQITAIGLNLSMFDHTAVPGSEPNDVLDQMLNVTKGPDEYDPEELYDPTEGL